MSKLTEEDLKFIEMTFGLTRVDYSNKIKVRDGYVNHGDMVYWRGDTSVDHVNTIDPSHSHNIRLHPDVYSIAKPKVAKIEYED